MSWLFDGGGRSCDTGWLAAHGLRVEARGRQGRGQQRELMRRCARCVRKEGARKEWGGAQSMGRVGRAGEGRAEWGDKRAAEGGPGCGGEGSGEGTGCSLVEWIGFHIGFEGVCAAVML